MLIAVHRQPPLQREVNELSLDWVLVGLTDCSVAPVLFVPTYGMVQYGLYGPVWGAAERRTSGSSVQHDPFNMAAAVCG